MTEFEIEKAQKGKIFYQIPHCKSASSHIALLRGSPPLAPPLHACRISSVNPHPSGPHRHVLFLGSCHGLWNLPTNRGDKTKFYQILQIKV